MFNTKGEIVQWYIDICHRTGIDNNVPWIDDLFLDIVILPNGDIILLDEDELDEALSTGTFTEDLYNLAWEETNKLVELIQIRKFVLVELAETQRVFIKAIMKLIN